MKDLLENANGFQMDNGSKDLENGGWGIWNPLLRDMGIQRLDSMSSADIETERKRNEENRRIEKSDERSRRNCKLLQIRL